MAGLRGGFKKKIIEFSNKLTRWVLDDPVFHYEKTQTSKQEYALAWILFFKFC